MLLGRLAERFVLIGDPGQIPPVVTTDTSRWETAPRPPHRAAPQVIWHDDSITSSKFELPGTRRLPADSAALIKELYDFDFESFAAPGQRRVITEKRGRSAEDRAIDLLGDGTAVGLTIPTPDAGPPMDVDEQLAEHAALLASRLLDRSPRCEIDGRAEPLEPKDIGMVSTHRVMNAALERAVSTKIKGVRVDTPERWQGLERPVMIAVHPLSGVTRPSSFDLETGRLCVMASRHKAGLILLSRDHVGDTLRDFISTADQPLGSPDVNGRGHRDNLNFWTSLRPRAGSSPPEQVQIPI